LEFLLLISGGTWWLATLAFTLLAGTGFRPVAHCLLLGLNALHFLIAYVLVVRTGRYDDAAQTFTAVIAWLGAYLLVVGILISAGIPWPESLVLVQDEPIALDGAIVSTSLSRFTIGVVAGCLAAASLTVLLSLLYSNAGRRHRRRLLTQGVLAGSGLILGFSRQGFVSLAAGGLVVVGLMLSIGGKVRRSIRAAGSMLAITAIVVFGLRLVPPTRTFYEAFAARVILLFQPDAYTTGTVLGRAVMWSNMLNDVEQSPFVGHGQDAYLIYMSPEEEGSHNFPLEVLHTAGFAGFLAYAVFHATVLWSALAATRRRTRRGKVPYALIGLLGAYVALVLASVTNLIFWSPAYWMVGGLLAGASTIVRREDRLDAANAAAVHPIVA
jgi:O-antigen ligase